MIVIVIFIMIIKKTKQNTFSGHHKYNEPKGAKRYVWNNLTFLTFIPSGVSFFSSFMYSIYLYLYRSSASFLEIQMKKHKRAAFCECCANNIFLHQITSFTVQTDTPPSPLGLFTNTKSSTFSLIQPLTVSSDRQKLQPTVILAGKCTSIQ